MATRLILMPIYILQLTGVLLFTQGEYNKRLVAFPAHPTFCKLGNCSELSWSYQLRQGDEVSKVTFGTWVYSKGYVEQILVRVKPNHVYIRPNYRPRLTWTGNFSCRASVRLCNVSKEDETYYGVEIDIRGKTSLMNGTELRVTSFDPTPPQMVVGREGFVPTPTQRRESGGTKSADSSSGLFIPLTAAFVALLLAIAILVTWRVVHSRRARLSVSFKRMDQPITL